MRLGLLDLMRPPGLEALDQLRQDFGEGFPRCALLSLVQDGEDAAPRVLYVNGGGLGDLPPAVFRIQAAAAAANEIEDEAL
jgi:hypothetical protein